MGIIVFASQHQIPPSAMHSKTPPVSPHHSSIGKALLLPILKKKQLKLRVVTNHQVARPRLHICLSNQSELWWLPTRYFWPFYLRKLRSSPNFNSLLPTGMKCPFTGKENDFWIYRVKPPALHSSLGERETDENKPCLLGPH